jgi:hypothetical protein
MNAPRALAIAGFAAGAVLALAWWWASTQPQDPDEGEDPVDTAPSSKDPSSLVGNAARAAAALQTAYPGVVFTSCRRTRSDQASAMAANEEQDHAWISETYVGSDVEQACQAYCAAHPNLGQSDLAAGLLAILNGFSDTALHKLSYHLAGQAFDVQPGSCDVSAFASLVSQATGAGELSCKFLPKEGGLTRWHLQIGDDVTVPFSLLPPSNGTNPDDV